MIRLVEFGVLAVTAAMPIQCDVPWPTILIHGAANSARVWTFWKRGLVACGWPTYAIDLCGHGDSSAMDLSRASLMLLHRPLLSRRPHAPHEDLACLTIHGALPHDQEGVVLKRPIEIEREIHDIAGRPPGWIRQMELS